MSGLGCKCEEPRLSPGLSFDCYVFSLAGWGELFGVGDVVWFQMVRGGGGLTGFLGAGKAYSRAEAPFWVN